MAAENTLKQNPDDIIPISFDKILQAQSYSVFIMRNEHKQFAIYSDPSIGKILQAHMSTTGKSRPLTHDLVLMIIKGFDATIKRVVITDFQDTIYFAKLCLQQNQQDKKILIELDARPSDCITLAIMNNSPIYCTRRVLENSIPFTEP